MKLFELINPSDKYTFYAPNIEIAGFCAFALSPGFGAREITQDDNGETTPVLIGWGKWLKDRGIEGDQWFYEHLIEIADAFDSFVIGDRHEYESSIKYMSKKAAIEYKKERQDRQRSSVNDIGEAAYEYAKKCRELYKAKKDGDA